MLFSDAAAANCTLLCPLTHADEDPYGGGLSVETLIIDEDDTAVQSRGRRLTSADFIGEHRVIAVRRSLYKLHCIESEGGILAPFFAAISEPWSPLNPHRTGVLTPVSPDALLLGPSSLRPLEDLLVIPRRPSAALALLNDLLNLHREQHGGSIGRPMARPLGVEPMVPDRELFAFQEAQYYPSYEAEGDAAGARSESCSLDDGNSFFEEGSAAVTEGPTPGGKCDAWLECIEVEMPRAEYDGLTARTAELEKSLVLKRQNVVNAIASLAWERRLLQSHSVSWLPPLTLTADSRLSRCATASADLQPLAARATNRLLSLCEALVQSVSSHQQHVSRKAAADAVAAALEQHSHLVGAVRALTAAYGDLAIFRARCDSREAIRNSCLVQTESRGSSGGSAGEDLIEGSKAVPLGQSLVYEMQDEGHEVSQPATLAVPADSASKSARPRKAAAATGRAKAIRKEQKAKRAKTDTPASGSDQTGSRKEAKASLVTKASQPKPKANTVATTPTAAAAASSKAIKTKANAAHSEGSSLKSVLKKSKTKVVKASKDTDTTTPPIPNFSNVSKPATVKPSDTSSLDSTQCTQQQQQGLADEYEHGIDSIKGEHELEQLRSESHAGFMPAHTNMKCTDAREVVSEAGGSELAWGSSAAQPSAGSKDEECASEEGSRGVSTPQCSQTTKTCSSSSTVCHCSHCIQRAPPRTNPGGPHQHTDPSYNSATFAEQPTSASSTSTSSFMYDALASLPSKELRHSSRSKVFDMIQRQASEAKIRRGTEAYDFRKASTFPGTLPPARAAAATAARDRSKLQKSNSVSRRATTANRRASNSQTAALNRFSSTTNDRRDGAAIWGRTGYVAS